MNKQQVNLEQVFESINSEKNINLKRLQQYISQPSISAENNGNFEMCELLVDEINKIGGTAEINPGLDFPLVYGKLDNNAATAVIMTPIAYNIAIETNQSIDAFLMTVAIGASCAFLSPIGHQCNTLIMGPGNYKFSDYWKLGLPLEIIIIAISVPLIIFFWT